MTDTPYNPAHQEFREITLWFQLVCAHSERQGPIESTPRLCQKLYLTTDK